ncbi:MAG TPA: hypothetical protein VHR66_31275 [Gemmataceae bacterium]|jgi:hypothetical protein|nr:hypothetical protein [Gemmataceae bacterium]
MVRRTASFVAAARDGTALTVHVYTGYVVACPVNGRPELLEMDPEYWTDDGIELEKIGPGTFQMIATNEILHELEAVTVGRQSA